QVEARWKSWHKRRPSQSQYVPQLEWAPHIVEYVNWVYRLTDSAKAPLKAAIPLLGPRFLPPTYMHVNKRSATADIVPETSYLKALTVIHPLYFDNLKECPLYGENGDGVFWGGWTTTGHREVHGLDREETALGFQLRCTSCVGTAPPREKTEPDGPKGNAAESKPKYKCYSTTNELFWEKYEHWQIPGKSAAPDA
ncbi:hypothetical protein BV20DRAFT_953337, partial [Pilatotrama ljubarskyi]